MEAVENMGSNVFYSFEDIRGIDFDSIIQDEWWNTGDEKERKVHRIHAYPAKFPAFITSKALAYAKSYGLNIQTAADIFCGCGTVAYEARRNNIDFWGCDINPVATLIAKAKSEKYLDSKMCDYFEKILVCFYEISENEFRYNESNERIRYWFKEKQFFDLARLKKAIQVVVPEKSKYRLFFMCAFSNILKPTSVWLTKSIKPQVDPEKQPANVIEAFKDQFVMMRIANTENIDYSNKHVNVVNGNFLDKNIKPPAVDMIITSPPYVTSYEYADLHQLSTLWLGFVEDYKELREGTIGSLYHEDNLKKQIQHLNETGYKIVTQMYDKDKSKARSVAKYFLDMQCATEKSYGMLNANGLAVFVIGNTEYKNVRIDNTKHLVESFFNVGFKKIVVSKRKISNKILTPYRDKNGRFTTNSEGRKVYSEEFIVIGTK